MWQGSLEGDVDGLSSLPECLIHVSNAKEPPWPSFLKKSARSDNLSSVLNESEQNFCIPPPLSKNNVKLAERHSLNTDKFFSSNFPPIIDKNESEIKSKSVTKMEKLEKFASKLVMLILSEALTQSASMSWSIKCSDQCNQELCREDFKKRLSSIKEPKTKFSTLAVSTCSSSLCWTPEIPPFSPHKTSKRSSLSFSHDSLISSSGPTGFDDSHLITSAVSHDALVFSTTREQKSGLDKKKKTKNCMECLHTDIYSLPVDSLKTAFRGPVLQPKVLMSRQPPKKRRSQSQVANRKNSSSVNNKNNSNGDVVVVVASTAGASKRRIPKVKRRTDSQQYKGNKKKKETRNDTKWMDEALQEQEIEQRQPSGSTDNNYNISTIVVTKEDTEITEVDDKKKVQTTHNTSSKMSRRLFCSSKNATSTIANGNNDCSKRSTSNNNKEERKSLSSNIRNTLVTLFNFRKNYFGKELGTSVNAKNEFIDASSQGFNGISENASNGVKWGKICPLPSAPPIRKCDKNSAFSEAVLTTATQKRSKSLYTVNLASSNNNKSSNNNGICNISPASLLSCLGHPRTNSIGYDDRKEDKNSVNAANTSATSATENKVKNRALPPLPPSDEGCDFASIIEKVKNVSS